MRQIVLSTYMGNALETYDFILCGLLISRISPIFFPAESQILSTMLGLLVFGIGFLARPLGALYFGHIGDRRGRKDALSLSIIGMSFCTFALVFLPGFESWGLLSPAGFILLRLGQGFCIGGEGQGGSTFVVEHFWDDRPMLHGAIYATSNGLGALVATLVSLLLTLPSMPNWAWRFAFLIGSLVGFIGLFLRRRLSETPLFQEMQRKKEILKRPIAWVFYHNKLGFFCSFMFVATASSVTYVAFAFVNVFLTTILKMPTGAGLSYACLGILLAISSVLFFGWLSERLGAEKITLFSTVLLIILALPVHFLLGRGDSVSIIVALILLAIPTGGLCSLLPYFIAKFFPPKARYSGAAFSNNLAQGVFGGFQPFIAMFLIQKTGLYYTPGLYLLIISLSFLVIFLLYSKSKSVAPES